MGRIERIFKFGDFNEYSKQPPEELKEMFLKYIENIKTLVQSSEKIEFLVHGEYSPDHDAIESIYDIQLHIKAKE